MKFPSHRGSWALSWALSFISSIFSPLCFFSSILCPKFHLIFYLFLVAFYPSFYPKALSNSFSLPFVSSIISILSFLSSISFIHLLSRVSSSIYLFPVFASSVIKSVIHVLSLPGISSVKVFILSRVSHPSSLPSWCSNLQAFFSSVSSSRLCFLTCKDFGFDACCCFLELVRRFVPLLLLLLLLQSKEFSPSGAQGGCFFLGGRGSQTSPPLFFLSWCLEFAFFPLVVVYVLRICTSTFSISSSLFSLLCVLGSCCCCCCRGTWKSFMLLFKFCWGLGFEGLL